MFAKEKIKFIEVKASYYLTKKRHSLSQLRSSHWRFSIKKRPETCNFIKNETLAQVFSCEFRKIFMITFLTEHLWTTASDNSARMN